MTTEYRSHQMLWGRCQIWLVICQIGFVVGRAQVWADEDVLRESQRWLSDPQSPASQPGCVQLFAMKVITSIVLNAPVAKRWNMNSETEAAGLPCPDSAASLVRISHRSLLVLLRFSKSLCSSSVLTLKERKSSILNLNILLELLLARRTWGSTVQEASASFLGGRWDAVFPLNCFQS